MRHDIEAEIDRNFDALLASLSTLLPEHDGEFALLRAGKIVAFHSAESEALKAGRASYSDGLYSVQEVTRRPADLGFFSHAIDSRIAG